MNHEQAIQDHASMRYTLGEMTPDERDSFEEHYADCSFCMQDVEMSAAFAANAREVFREKPSKTRATGIWSWLQWRPVPALALSAALNVVLVAGIGYEVLQRHPGTRSANVTVAAAETVDVVPVRAATRGSEASGQVVQATSRPLVLTFDLPETYPQYSFSIDSAGTPVLSGALPAPGQSDALNLRVPLERLPAGEYQVTVTGINAAARESLGTCMLRVPAR